MKLLVSRSAFWVGLAWLRSANRLAAQEGVSCLVGTITQCASVQHPDCAFPNKPLARQSVEECLQLT